MADDIVTRLQDIASQCWCAEKSQGEPVGKPFFRCESCDDQLQAADEIERLRGEADEAGQLLERMTVLLHRIANALHGGPRPNGLHSWHDLPELAAQLREEARRG